MSCGAKGLGMGGYGLGIRLEYRGLALWKKDSVLGYGVENTTSGLTEFTVKPG